MRDREQVEYLVNVIPTACLSGCGIKQLWRGGDKKKKGCIDGETKQFLKRLNSFAEEHLNTFYKCFLFPYATFTLMSCNLEVLQNFLLFSRSLPLKDYQEVVCERYEKTNP